MTKWSKYIQLYFFKTLPPSAYIPNAANITTKSATFAFSSLLFSSFFTFLYFLSFLSPSILTEIFELIGHKKPAF